MRISAEAGGATRLHAPARLRLGEAETESRRWLRERPSYLCVPFTGHVCFLIFLPPSKMSEGRGASCKEGGAVTVLSTSQQMLGLGGWKRSHWDPHPRPVPTPTPPPLRPH